jgi:hypothetical protein
MNNVKAMYQTRNILARTISAPELFFGEVFVTCLANKFAIWIA